MVLNLVLVLVVLIDLVLVLLFILSFVLVSQVFTLIFLDLPSDHVVQFGYFGDVLVENGVEPSLVLVELSYNFLQGVSIRKTNWHLEDSVFGSARKHKKFVAFTIVEERVCLSGMHILYIWIALSD